MNNEQPPNEHTDPWESEMSREFDKRVRDLHEAPLTFDNVKGKAMTIRRNRRIAVAGGILAAAAVVVPIAALAGNGLGDTDNSPDPAVSPTITQATDPNDPTPPTEAPDPTTVGVSYLEGSTWHRVDGTTVELDEAYFSAVELGDQLVATSNTNGRFTVDVIDADGNVVDSDKAYSQPVANADHTTVAYITREGELMTRWADGQVGMGDGFVDGDSVAAITGGPNCFEVEDGCVAYVNHGDGSAPVVLDSHGTRDVATPNAIKVNDLSASGLVAAQISYSDTGSCSEVFDPSEGTQVFETCDASLFAFSPDASYLTGSSSYLDGIGPGYMTILDGTSGTEVARLSPDQAFVGQSVWEDAEHVLVTAYNFEQGEWRIYRLGVDGSSEQVLSSTDGDEMTPAFTLLGAS